MFGQTVGLSEWELVGQGVRKGATGQIESD